MKRHVALIGFMAAGKSTIGRKLARELRCEFFDTDDLVAREHGAVATIFSREGEDAFRRYERAAIAAVLESETGGVVALGGGALTVAANRHVLAQRAHRIFIKVSPQQVLRRVRQGRARPLLGPAPTLASVDLLYKARMPHYATADHIVEAERLSGRAILDDILQWLHEKRIGLSP